jgi:hypothetical protein
MCVICVLCLIVVPLPPGENPFAVKINNNKNIQERQVVCQRVKIITSLYDEVIGI